MEKLWRENVAAKYGAKNVAAKCGGKMWRQNEKDG
jgi:hypothetical protein